MGGEEFALLLDGVDAEKACRAAESLRHRIAMTDIDTGAATLRLSCSFGVAIGAPEDDIDALLRKADAALYAAKRAGRNRVAFYDADSRVPANSAGQPHPRRRTLGFWPAAAIDLLSDAVARLSADAAGSS